jgi:hypothetical protein
MQFEADIISQRGNNLCFDGMYEESSHCQVPPYLHAWYFTCVTESHAWLRREGECDCQL